MYKIGDKVEYCGVVSTIVAINEAQRVMSVVYKEEQEQGAVVGFDSVKPYHTAHEKLIELGFTYSKDGNNHQYEKTLSGGRKDYNHNFMVIIVAEKEKMFKGYKSINDYFTGHFSTYELSFDLELARIMVQYLEELKGE